MDTVINPVEIDINPVVDFLCEVYGVSDWRQSILDVQGEYLCLPFEVCLLRCKLFDVFVSKKIDNEGNASLVFGIAGLHDAVISAFNSSGVRGVFDLVVPLSNEGTCRNPLRVLLGDPHNLRFINPDNIDGETFDAIAWIYSRCLFALWLMGWKREVELREPTITRQQRRQSERTGIPCSKTKSLNIEPWKKMFTALRSRCDSNSNQSPYSMVRGHRSIYTSSNPMFGCKLCMLDGHKDGSTPHVGTFWIAPHFVGNKENGTIHHEYRVAV